VGERLLEVVISPCINHSGWARTNACAMMIHVGKNCMYATGPQCSF
jgi:hypothetical protein